MANQSGTQGYQIDIKNVEKIFKKGARFATGNYLRDQGNSKKILDTLSWESLEERRLQTKLSSIKLG